MVDFSNATEQEVPSKSVLVLQVFSWAKFLLMSVQKQCGSTVAAILVCNLSLLLYYYFYPFISSIIMIII